MTPTQLQQVLDFSRRVQNQALCLDAELESRRSRVGEMTHPGARDLLRNPRRVSESDPRPRPSTSDKPPFSRGQFLDTLSYS